MGTKIIKRLLAVVLTLSLLIVTAPIIAAPDNSVAGVVADWIFDANPLHSTSVNGYLEILDVSNNGNTLEMEYFDRSALVSRKAALDATTLPYGSFVDDKMTEEGGGSFKFSPNNARSGTVQRRGVDFITNADAPVNKNEFRNGYTIEFIFKHDINALSNSGNSSQYRDQWMGLMGRQGLCAPAGIEDNGRDYNYTNYLSKSEPWNGTMNLSVSDLNALQYSTAVADNDYYPYGGGSNIYSHRLIKDRWHHIAVVSDNTTTRLYLDGIESWMGYYGDVGANMIGMYADPDSGRFIIGSARWIEPLALESNDMIDALLRGNIERVRISERGLTPAEFLISDPFNTLDYSTPGNNDAFEMMGDGGDFNYNVVFVPDTQYNAQSTPFIIDSGMKWLADNKYTANVPSVNHLGDITENNLIREWNDAYKSYSFLADAGVSTTMLCGNHDISGGNANYLNTFGPNSEWTRKINADGQKLFYSPSGISQYTKFNAGSYEYLVIAMGNPGTATAEINWLRGVLDGNPGLPTIVTSHNLVNNSGGIANTTLWNAVRVYDQVFLLVGGHLSGANSGVVRNANGKDVRIALADYQSHYGAGFGYLRFCEFDELNNKIYVRTFSPFASRLPAAEKGRIFWNFLENNCTCGANEIENNTVWDFDFGTRFPVMPASIAIVETVREIIIDHTCRFSVEADKPTAIIDVSWTSSDEDVATVDDNGLVTAVGLGFATITAVHKMDENVFASTDIEVIPLRITGASTPGTSGSVKITEYAKNMWDVTFTVTEYYNDGSVIYADYSVSFPKNGDGTIDLGDYSLIYDIKGNGSNIKAFRIVMN